MAEENISKSRYSRSCIKFSSLQMTKIAQELYRKVKEGRFSCVASSVY